MAFVTTFITKAGEDSNAYNIDFSVGAGARGNLPDDIMLVQALFRIVHFRLNNPVTPPAGETGIEVDGKLGPRTLRFMLNWQRLAKKNSLPVLVDGVFDPFRLQGQRSSIAKVQYAMEILNHTAFGQCRREGSQEYDRLPFAPDIPPALAGALKAPPRKLARKYDPLVAH